MQTERAKERHRGEPRPPTDRLRGRTIKVKLNEELRVKATQVYLQTRDRDTSVVTLGIHRVF